jgi:hypothetical protein
MTTNIKTKRLGYFRGVDYSSDPSEVADYRLAECENMYKDYHSGQGQAIETIPGFRLIKDFGEKIYGIHIYQKGDEKTLLVHAGDKLYKAESIEITDETVWTPLERTVPIDGIGHYKDLIMSERKSSSFNFNNRLYIIDGKNYVFYSDGAMHNALENTYVPTTHRSLRPDNSDLPEPKNGGQYSQQNILNEWYKATYVADGENMIFTLPYGIEEAERREASVIYYVNEGGGIYNPIYSDEDSATIFINAEIRQYGVFLPWATKDERPPVRIHSFEEITHNGEIIKVATKYSYYPNAVKSISAEGVVELVYPPPKPEDNRSGLDNGEFIEDEKFRYPAGSAGIEISAKKKVTTIKGITSSSDNVGSIITGCTISTVHDGRVFLSGNPDYPNFVFFCGRNPETGFIDPSYFGIVDWFSEGVNNTPITALMPIADTLMVLRKDTVQDGSVTYRTRYETNENYKPVTYTGTGGLPGVGCLGANCNFLDDPIFVSKYGIEAMGQLSARYERAIEHRSNLIDGLLLNKNLENASIAEFDGYMWVLIDGEIFLADSRQRYTHSSGVMNYEWFYLKDIGVYKDQKLQVVYADLTDEYKDYTFNRSEIGDYKEYKLVTIEELKKLGYEVDSSIGDPIEEGKNVMRHNRPGYDSITYIHVTGYGNYAVIVKYAEYYGGGTFDPAMLIKAVDNKKLMFGTEGGSLCMFNFDKRDNADKYKIPNQYYTFNGRIIKSVLATKMDNCGVLNYVKNTVKKSMVVKMRTFEKSGAKVFVCTNRQTGHEVERLIGGRWDDITTDFNFEKLTCETDEKNIFRVREKEKKWLEKQLFLVSDEFKEPFALHYIAYDFMVTGRYKD